MTTKVVKGSIWSLVGQIAPLAMSLVATPFVIRLLGSEGYGVLILVGLIPSYFGFADLGMSIASTKFASEAFSLGEKEKEGRIVRTAAVIAVAGSIPVAAVLIVFSDEIVNLFNVPEYLRIDGSFALKIAAVTFVVNFMNGIFNTPQLTRLRMDINTLVTSGFRMLGIVGTPVGLYLGFGIVGASVVLLTTSLATLVGHLYASSRLLPELISTTIDRTIFRPLFKFGGAFAISTVAAMILGSTEKFVLARKTSVQELAFYSVAFTIATMMTMFSGSMVQSLIPAFSQLQALNDRNRLNELYYRCIRLVLIAFIPALVIVAIIARPFLTIWAGDEFGLKSSYPLYVLLSGLLVNAVAYFPSAIIITSGRTDVLAKIYWIEVIVYLPIVFLLVSSLGAVGAAIAWSIRVIIDAAILFLFANRISGVSVMRREAVWIVVALVVLLIPLVLMIHVGRINLEILVTFVIAFGLYAILVWTKFVTRAELDWILERLYGAIGK